MNKLENEKGTSPNMSDEDYAALLVRLKTLVTKVEQAADKLRGSLIGKPQA